jgi:hypothetical protein
MLRCIASEAGAVLDSNVRTGGGTDDTAVLQALLDRAPTEGGVHLILDGAARVTGLTVYSDTTIECPNPSCGLFLADGADRAILRNAHPSDGTVFDRHITLVGGTYNGNAAHQVHHTDDNRWVTGMDFFGVEHLSVRHVIIRDQRTFALFVANFQHVYMHDVRVLLDTLIPEGNQDGLHFCGPGRFLTLRDIQGTSWDDFIALNADDGHTYYADDGSLAARGWPHIGFGPITDVLIDGVTLDGAAQGVRFLSRISLIDRVVVRNVTGTYTSFGFFMDPFWERGGNYGSILIENVDLRALPPNFDYMPNFLFALGGHHRHVTLRNITHLDACDSRRTVYIEDDAQIDHLRVDGFHVCEGESTPPGASQIIVNGQVDHLVLHGVTVRRPAGAAPAGALVEVIARDVPHGIRRLVLDDVCAEGLDCLLLLRGGTVEHLTLRDAVGCPAVREAGGTVGALTPADR